MADEAFALSPISAKSASPREEDDYNAIREAFMETARGRWFLGEYTKRNRNADTAMVLDAVARIEQRLEASRTEAAAIAPATDSSAAVFAARADGILASVKIIVERTRTALVAALSATDIEEMLSPFRRSARIIQEIAWGLRESGADGRICTILDAQVQAMTAACEALAAADHRDAVLQAFDANLLQIENLADAASADQTMAPGNESSILGPLQNDTQTVAANAPPETSIPDTDATVIETASTQVKPTVPLASGNGLTPENQTAQSSLGDSLIAHGIFESTMATADPLAPIRRMSQAEKIAFFS